MQLTCATDAPPIKCSGTGASDTVASQPSYCEARLNKEVKSERKRCPSFNRRHTARNPLNQKRALVKRSSPSMKTTSHERVGIRRQQKTNKSMLAGDEEEFNLVFLHRSFVSTKKSEIRRRAGTRVARVVSATVGLLRSFCNKQLTIPRLPSSGAEWKSSVI
ncbi:hypothetical protein EVAR_16771_1 [Eumeta japonica]|uniref:Uncharacterized protein n=1 Tax=Eumeta variegata TaxID=151549 RepID=A0A4C1UKW7_EUMVA|nr:hypothetical protein EVAR_16771_1 [Eumeta japonica]